MKKIVVVLAVLSAAPSSAQTAQAPATATGVELSGSLTPGVLQLDNSTNSSKLTEYRDLRDNFLFSSVSFSAADNRRGWFFTLNGANLSRDDQTILVEGGRPGAVSIGATWVEIPHNLSNKAVTPYIRRGPGLFDVPATVPITFKRLAPAAADIGSVLASDELIAAYQGTFLAPTPLGTQTNTGRLALDWSGSDVLNLEVAYNRRSQAGLKSAFGPIGDRPPRTLNIQLTEPVDYRTNELTLAAEHQGRGFQVRGEYLISDFENRIDTLQWQNVYATPAAPGATFDIWDRAVSVYGVRPLPPDNRFQNVSASFGGDLPYDSRFTTMVAYGRYEQNQTLLPYSYHQDQLAVSALPRSTAEALINTITFAADYVIVPVRRVNLRGFYRRYDLNNETPSSRWQYVTSDTSTLAGTVTYLNKRVSVPFAWDRDNAGVEATVRLPSRSSLLLGLEHEAIGRQHREADTGETIFRATWRTRPTSQLSLQARYLHGARNADGYHSEVTRERYWYAPSEATDNNNPALTFDNHPDMRRFDVSDRLRRQFDMRATLTPGEIVSLSGYVRVRKDDFDSEVAPSQPLLGSGLPEERAASPGDQLGWLEDTRTRLGADVFIQPDERVALNAFVSFDKGGSLQRSIEFQENNKANPGAVATLELGPWTRAGSQWTADFDDRTWNLGLGTTLQIVPNRLALAGDYNVSLAEVDVAYSGFGVTNFDGTPFPPNHQFSFSSPPTIRIDQHVLNLRVEIPLSEVMLVAAYSFEKYLLDDWQQGSSFPWVEPVGADTLLRDTSRSIQWGNRLFNLGTFLAPDYNAHIVFVGLTYRF